MRPIPFGWIGQKRAVDRPIYPGAVRMAIKLALGLDPIPPDLAGDKCPRTVSAAATNRRLYCAA